MAVPGVDEKDWKLFRKVREAALQRESQKIVEELAKLGCHPDKTWHERYLAIVETLRKRQRELAYSFDDFRRSTMFQQLLIMRTRDVVSDAELQQFSEKLRDSLAYLLKPRPDDDEK